MLERDSHRPQVMVVNMQSRGKSPFEDAVMSFFFAFLDYIESSALYNFWFCLLRLIDECAFNTL